MTESNEPGAVYLAAERVDKTFGRFTALKDISFEAGQGEFLSILGPSGCGKTTLLRVIAGLETQDSGKVIIQGRDVSDLPISRRNIGIVFQSYALFPNLSAWDNIAYGLKNQSRDRTYIRERVGELFALVGLSGLERKYPAQLSGGQQQRVALARALALSPQLLLLDEPLSALDAKVRLSLRSEIRTLQQRLGVTTIMVTHDQEEALTMADRVLVMNQGVLAQLGTPQEIYERPNSPFVASFIGSMNFLDNAVKERDDRYQVGSIRLAVEHKANGLPEGAKAMVAIRPEDIVFLTGTDSRNNVVPARIRLIEFRGSIYRIGLDVRNGTAPMPLNADVGAEHARVLELRKGKEVMVHLPPDRIKVYEETL
jgi:iron(III) transport system ATP-binding protein